MLKDIVKEIETANKWYAEGDNVWGYALDEIEKHLLLANQHLLDYSSKKGFSIDYTMVFKKSYVGGSIDLTFRQKNLLLRGFRNMQLRIVNLIKEQNQINFTYAIYAFNTFIKFYEDLNNG